MNSKLVLKFLVAFVFLILASVLILNFFAGFTLKGIFEDRVAERLESNATLVGDILFKDIKAHNRNDIQARLARLGTIIKARVTVLDDSGDVLGETGTAPGAMDNHLLRGEIRQALRGGIGQSNRFSDTLGFEMKYVAVVIKDESEVIGFVRLSLPHTEVAYGIQRIYRAVLMGGLVAIVFVLIMGFIISRRIITPITEMKEVAQAIAAGDLTRRIHVSSRDELGVLAIAMNRMAEETQRTIDNLRRLDGMRSEFVANVSHELKTPLTSIKGFIETLEDGALEDEENARHFLSIISKNADALSNIINDLLALSEIESGRQSLEPENFAVDELIGEIADGFAHSISEHGHELILDAADLSVIADRRKVEQVIENLLGNAIRYTPRGGRIAIAATRDQSGVAITIEDNGIGISEEHQGRIFERFYRVDKARSRKLGGTGLGLAIVKHTVILLGGDVSVESFPGKGTKVRLTLPGAPSPSAQMNMKFSS